VLGTGASGVIWRATWRETGREVAVKVFKGAVTSDGLPEDEVRASLLAGSHAHLVAPLGRVVDHPEGADALVLSLIPPSYRALGGPPDFQSCTRDVMPRDLALTAAQFHRVVEGIASLGAHLHARGVSHGDLYAHNTRIDAEGHALVGDFGAASVLTGLDDDVRAGLERVEVRAFGVLIDDLLTVGAPAGLAELRDACASLAPPRFVDVQGLPR
jgi:serine/threonine protein kinase